MTGPPFRLLDADEASAISEMLAAQEPSQAARIPFPADATRDDAQVVVRTASDGKLGITVIAYRPGLVATAFERFDSPAEFRRFYGIAA